MKSSKDFIYKISDILIAIAIILVAAAIIFWRMDVIMDYPDTLDAQTAVEETQNGSEGETPAKEPAKEPSKEPAKEPAAPEENGSGLAVWNGDVLSKDMTVNVASGSATAAAQSLVDAGLFKDYDEFSKVCSNADVKPENIKAGTFNFSAGITKQDIVKAVTN